MVSAVNQVFMNRTVRLSMTKISHSLPVAASPSADKRQWVMNGETQHALTFLAARAEDKPLPKGEYHKAMAEAAAVKFKPF